MHAGRHHTLAAIVKTMEVGAALKFVYTYVRVKNRRLVYGEIVDTCRDLPDMEISHFLFTQAVFCVVGFPAHMTFAVDRLGPPLEDQVYHLVEKSMSDELMLFAKPKKSLGALQGVDCSVNSLKA
jgi:hypothetical protein